MDALGTVLVWICAAMVALPLAPCAFFTNPCSESTKQAKVEAAAQQDRSCCAHRSAPVEQPAHRPERKPCSGECCLLSPFVPPLEKTAPAPQALAPVSAHAQIDDLPAAIIISPSIALAEPLSLCILHCQWRC